VVKAAPLLALTGAAFPGAGAVPGVPGPGAAPPPGPPGRIG
jgi:hypothetical protein